MVKQSSKLIIAPSILSSDYSKLGAEVKAIEKAGADWVHIDIMDGHFVPNITIGPAILESIKTKLFVDTHLMIEQPEKFIEDFINAGSKMITFHPETTDVKQTIKLIRSFGAKVGLAINPDKKIDLVTPYLDDIDLVLVMSVFPGFGSQKFIEDVVPKIKALRRLKPSLLIEVDGGINEKTIEMVVKAGANVIVSGSYVFGGDYAQRIKVLKSAGK